MSERSSQHATFTIERTYGATPERVFAAWADPEPCQTATTLRTAQSEIDRRLIAVVERLGMADLNRVVDIHRGDRIQRERLDRLLLHLFQHQIHHRGQAHAMLSSTGVRPPQLDEFFLAGEEELRRDELRALGLPLR